MTESDTSFPIAKLYKLPRDARARGGGWGFWRHNVSFRHHDLGAGSIRSLPPFTGDRRPQGNFPACKTVEVLSSILAMEKFL